MAVLKYKDPTTGEYKTLSGGGGSIIADGVPIGVIMQYSANTAPENYLFCDGSSLLRTDYPDLFNLIGTMYGSVDTNHFNLPDIQERVPIGKSANSPYNVLNNKGGEANHILTVSELASHTHTQNEHNHTQNEHTHTQNSHTHGMNSHTHSVSITSGNNSVGHTHSVGAHSHGLNNHTHSIPALSGTAASAGAHTHTGRYLGMNVSSGGVGSFLLRRISSADKYDGTSQITNSGGAHTHSVSTNTSTTGGNSGSTANSTAFNSGGVSANHTHSVSGNTGAATGSTSGTTATNIVTVATNNATIATNQNTGSSVAHNNMQPYIVLNYIIKVK